MNIKGPLWVLLYKGETTDWNWRPVDWTLATHTGLIKPIAKGIWARMDALTLNYLERRTDFEWKLVSLTKEEVDAIVNSKTT